MTDRRPGRITPLPAGAAEPLSVLHAACFPEDAWDAAAFERILGLAGAFGCLVWRDEDPVGFALARDLGGEAEILTLGVLPGMRRTGLARRLLAEIVTQAERRDAKTILLEVAADNDAARALYAEAGFLRVGRRPRYYRRGDTLADALILRRTLTPDREA